jgi:two-component system, NarL family, nitrate/nitrite response regulator NarL
MVRIVIADDHPIFRDGLKALLETEPEFDVVGEAGNGLEAVRAARELTPDVLLLDVSMPQADGLGVLEQIASAAPSVRTMLLTASIDGPSVVMAIQRGARGVVLKECATPMLFNSIRSVMEGHYWFDSSNVRLLIDGMRKPREAPPAAKPRNKFNLTPRELEIVGGITAGESNKEIASRLSIREDTVKHHLSHIFDKVGVFSRLELALFAINHGLQPREPSNDTRAMSA